MVMRQFGSEQFIPITHRLNQLEFSYGEPGTSKKVKEIVKAWKQTYRVNPGRYTDDITTGYLVWHVQRVKDIVVPPPTEPNDQVSQESPDIVAKIKEKFESEKATLKRQNEELQKEVCRLKGNAEKQARKMRRLCEERDEWKKNSGDCNDTLSSLTRELRILKQENDQLQVELNEKESQNEEVQASKNELAWRLQLQRESIQVLRNECEQLESSLQAFRQQYDELQITSETWRHVFLLRQSQVEHLLRQIRKAMIAATQMGQIADALRKEVHPTGTYGQRFLNFLDVALDQY